MKFQSLTLTLDLYHIWPKI